MVLGCIFLVNFHDGGGVFLWGSREGLFYLLLFIQLVVELDECMDVWREYARWVVDVRVEVVDVREEVVDVRVEVVDVVMMVQWAWLNYN